MGSEAGGVACCLPAAAASAAPHCRQQPLTLPGPGPTRSTTAALCCCCRSGSAAQAAGGGGGGKEEAPASTSVINYTYFDSARKDTLIPAAKKRPNLSAADAIKLQDDSAAPSGSGKK